MLINLVVTRFLGPRDVAHRNDIIRTLAAGLRPAELPPGLGGMVGRHAAVAVVINDFYWSLFGESRATPYPTKPVEQALRTCEVDIDNHRHNT